MIQDKSVNMENYIYEIKPLILRDYLAVDRTILANERTLLAWLRTSFNLVLAGISVMKIFNTLMAEITGVIIILSGLVFLYYGVSRYIKHNNNYNHLKS